MSEIQRAQKVMEQHKGHWEDDIVKVIFDSLEKQVPKKILDIDNRNACPHCRKKLPNIVFENLSCCSHCGQKLDWSEPNE
ncbi:hypothetical protein Cpap_1484 [Ruminiclostridium papyrosolvens DSM 2782]|uniref:Uncharacterized protein n=1 Tax=Ruminiclostridium papyrosolvens DSM 2782 TaxID=588581 RepID=F1TEC6_9FIRM|nr:hypothetical protein [Ruminiclostridium papyrosolvens]EGD47092.1 hypothetical protein Cpap_1484 [Ruminiclostridium papyrosolvens DSM 2782]WES36034.1 hypothetical protein P0092_08750 [Ruminiclostridium papyrosolvens DSM 2782]WES36132.1 hypothetical protein P0092_09250 [Ruminiclostridium papyrosolvens DSM 2782]